MTADAPDKEDYLRRFLPAESSLRGYILTHVGDLDVAEDLLQETALVLWQKFGQYDPTRSFLAWALGIARLEILDSRRRRRPGRSLVDADLDTLVSGEILRLEPEMPRQRQLLRLCLRDLPASMTEAVRLRYEQGSSLDQIARGIGKSLAAVKVLLHRARISLQDCVRLRGES